MKRAALLIALVLMILTYGSIYANLQHHTEGWLSHQNNMRDHLVALNWAIVPPLWAVAPFITDGYADGFQFLHHHTMFCRTRADFIYHESNRCELDPDCDPVYRSSPCPAKESN